MPGVGVSNAKIEQVSCLSGDILGKCFLPIIQTYPIIFFLFLFLMIFSLISLSEKSKSTTKVVALFLLIIFLIVGYIICFKEFYPIGDDKTKVGEWIKTLVQASVPLIGFIYFLYQAISGSLFPTTNILLEATRDKKEPHIIYLKVTLERGDNWLARIFAANFFITNEENIRFDKLGKPLDKFDKEYISGWKDLYFPKRANDLILGPKERSQTMIRIDDESYTKYKLDSNNSDLDLAKSFYVYAMVEYQSVNWFGNAKSFAKIAVQEFEKE